MYFAVLLFFQLSAADFSLPGSASPDKYDSVFVNNSSGALVDGKSSSVTVPLILCACTAVSRLALNLPTSSTL